MHVLAITRIARTLGRKQQPGRPEISSRQVLGGQPVSTAALTVLDGKRHGEGILVEKVMALVLENSSEKMKLRQWR